MFYRGFTRNWVRTLGIGLALGAGTAAFANSSITELPQQLQGVGIEEHLGKTISSSLKFQDESGNSVTLGDYFNHGKPVILSLVYYECPNLCTLVLNGMVKSLSQVDLALGSQYEVVTVSIDPTETPELASQKKAAYLKQLSDKGAHITDPNAWHFLVGKKKAIDQLASEVGFQYKYDSSDRQYAHSAAIYALTPTGKISRYLYGLNFFPQDVKLALLEASDGKTSSISDRFLLFCYHYDPKTKKYSVALTKVMQAGGAGTVLIFGAYLGAFWQKERRDGKLEGRKRTDHVL